MHIISFKNLGYVCCLSSSCLFFNWRQVLTAVTTPLAEKQFKSAVHKHTGLKSANLAKKECCHDAIHGVETTADLINKMLNPGPFCAVLCYNLQAGNLNIHKKQTF